MFDFPEKIKTGAALATPALIILLFALVTMVLPGCSSSPASHSSGTPTTAVTRVYSDQQMLTLFNDPVVQNMLGYPVTESNLQATLADQCPIINAGPVAQSQDIQAVMASYEKALRDSGRCTAALVNGS